jgi:hypothetical protein
VAAIASAKPALDGLAGRLAAAGPGPQVVAQLGSSQATPLASP